MKTSTALKAAALAAAAVLPVVTLSTATATAAGASAIVTTTPGTVYVAADESFIDVKVTYKCRNATDVRYYLDGMVKQNDDAAAYVYGHRNDSTGTKVAKCTGSSVTQTVRFLRSYWADERPDPVNGTADLTVRLDARGALGAGWYNERTPDYSIIRTVNLVTR